MNLEKGLVHIYTGEGKGKTTAALGMALRAVRHGLRVYFIQFIKDATEENTVRGIEGIDYKFFENPKSNGRWKWIYKAEIKNQDKKIAKEGLKFAEKIILNGTYDVVILDEIIIAIWFGLIDEGDVLTLIKKKPKHVELILTGRRASKKLINAADYVSDIRKIKHPYDEGILAREGIDY